MAYRKEQGRCVYREGFSRVRLYGGACGGTAAEYSEIPAAVNSYIMNTAEQMMKDANAQGVNVVETLKGVPFAKANENARYTLKSVIGEDEDRQAFVNANEYRCTIRAKGSHMFMFAEFD